MTVFDPNPASPAARSEGRARWTLLDLVASVAESADTHEEVIATVTHLLGSGRVVLTGCFRGEDLRPRVAPPA